ncbi:unnamed protein product, partial [Ectocarpus sp. 8 AP-2014]
MKVALDVHMFLLGAGVLQLSQAFVPPPSPALIAHTAGSSARHAACGASRLRRRRSAGVAQMAAGDHEAKLNKGFGILELAGGLVPQGGLVKT